MLDSELTNLGLTKLTARGTIGCGRIKRGVHFVTNIGIALRKIRLDKQELLRDMAAKLNVSSAFLSAVENGRKKPPANFVDKVCNAYDLGKTDRETLLQAAEMATHELKINLADVSPAQRQVAVSFAKALNGLTDEQVKKIMTVFEKKKGC